MYVEIQREELGTEASRRTQTHEVCMIVIVEQLKLHEVGHVKSNGLQQCLCTVTMADPFMVLKGQLA